MWLVELKSLEEIKTINYDQMLDATKVQVIVQKGKNIEEIVLYLIVTMYSWNSSVLKITSS